jgi:pseudouridine-5'-phosphate glycosidase
MNRHNGGTCAQRVVTLAATSMVVVIGLEQNEFEILLKDERPLKDGLRDLGVLVGRVA